MPVHSNGGTLEEIEREAILRALRSTNWMVGGVNGAATMLGVKRTTLQARMQRLGIAPARSPVTGGRCEYAPSQPPMEDASRSRPGVVGLARDGV